MTTISLPIIFTDGFELARSMENLLISDTRQQRQSLISSPCLRLSAVEFCLAMVRENLFAHCLPISGCPNPFVRKWGCRIPDRYGDGNSLQSLVAGTKDVLVAIDALAKSPSHADHLFGRNEFFRQQTHIGVGFLESPGSMFTYYFCIHISEIDNG